MLTKIALAVVLPDLKYSFEISLHMIRYTALMYSIFINTTRECGSIEKKYVPYGVFET